MFKHKSPDEVNWRVSIDEEMGEVRAILEAREELRIYLAIQSF